MSGMVYKIIFTGPVGAGKTTAINVISDIPTVRTESIATDMTRERKAETTVAMDYGRINLPNNTAVHLYGTPGQERFDFMWEILVEGGIGLVLLIDNNRPNPLQDIRFFVSSFKDFIQDTAVVVGVTHSDVKPQPSIEDYQRELSSLGLQGVPVFEVDARQKRDIVMLIESLLCSLDPMVESYKSS